MTKFVKTYLLVPIPLLYSAASRNVVNVLLFADRPMLADWVWCAGALTPDWVRYACALSDVSWCSEAGVCIFDSWVCTGVEEYLTPRSNVLVLALLTPTWCRKSIASGALRRAFCGKQSQYKYIAIKQVKTIYFTGKHEITAMKQTEAIMKSKQSDNDFYSSGTKTQTCPTLNTINFHWHRYWNRHWHRLWHLDTYQLEQLFISTTEISCNFYTSRHHHYINNTMCHSISTIS